MQLPPLRLLPLPAPLLLLAGCGAGSAGIIASTGDDPTNSATVLSGLEITDTDDPQSRAWRSPAKVRFTLTDQEGDRANVSLTFSTDGGMSFRPVTMAAGSRLSNLPPGDYEVTWPFADATDLGSDSYRPGVIVRAAVSGGNTRTVTQDMGNDPPVLLSVQTPDPAEDAEGIVQVGFLVADSSGDQVDLKVEFKFPEEDWQPARSVGVLSNEDTPEYALNNLDLENGELADTFFWESDFEPAANSGVLGQMAGLESDVRLRLTARDQFDVEGSSLVSLPFRVDNNRPPQALLDEGFFLLGVKDRGKIPLSFTVLDDESDDVQLAIQWKSAGGDFPLVRNGAGQEVELGSLSPEELRDLLENPARRRDRLDAQIAEEASTIYAGRFGTLASGLAPNQARLPELASSQAGLLAQGIVGRELEVVRPDRLEALEIGLAGACGAYVTEEGRSALVLYDSGGSTWRISEVDLADGTLLSTVGSGAGTPRAMGVDPMGETLFVGTDQDVFRVERFSGVVSAPVAHEMTDGPRALAALGDDVVLGTGDDELRRLDFGAGATTPNAVLMSGLAQPWGVVRDPLRASGIYLAESAAITGSAVPGRVVSVDLDQLVPEDIAAEVAPEDQGTLGSVPFPNVKALTLEGDGSGLLAVTSQAGRKELRSLALRNPFDLDGGMGDPLGQEADPFVREKDLVADVNGAVATSRLGIRVVAPWIGSSVGVSGGAAQARSIESYEATNQVVTLSSALDPAPAAGEGVRWRVQSRLENVKSSPTGRSATFLWDTSALPDPSAAGLRLLSADGDLDLSGSSTMRPYRSDWERAEPSLPAGDGPRSVFAADLDGDGDMDLVSANGNGGDLTLLFQTSPGTFIPAAAPLPAGNSPASVAAADLDGDGDMDLVSANSISDDLTLFFQTSPGTFTPAAAPLPAGAGPQSVAAADLDGDGDVDLVSANEVSDDLSLFFQTSAGTFTPAAAPLTAGDGPRSVAAADLDGDGDMDLVSANATSDNLSLFFQTSAGTFTPASAPLPVGDNPGAVAAADLDGDGDMDLVSANVSSEDLTLFFQIAPGSFAVSPAPLRAGPSLRSVVAIDLDTDGDVDLVSVNREDTLTLFFQTSAGIFTPAGAPLPAGNGPSSVAAADLDGDGDVDIVSTNSLSDDLTVWFQTSLGSIDSLASVLPAGATPESIAAADLDGDGDVDLVSANRDGDDLTLYFQTSPGRFTRTSDPIPSGNSPLAVAAADLDGDGDVDLVSANGATQDLKLFFQSSPGAFSSAPLSLDFPPGIAPRFVCVADLDGDGDADLVSGNLSLFLQTAPGVFSPKETLLPPGTALAVAAADLDGDGDLDLVSANDVSDDLALFFQTSPGIFTSDFVSLPAGDRPESVAAADLDGDGDMDLVSANRDSDDLSLFFQTSPGSFSRAPVSLPAGDGPSRVVAADLDGDGDIDLACTNRTSDSMTLYLQTDPGKFTQSGPSLSAGEEPVGVVAADLDSDSDLDLVTTDRRGDELRIYFNGN